MNQQELIPEELRKVIMQEGLRQFIFKVLPLTIGMIGIGAIASYVWERLVKKRKQEQEETIEDRVKRLTQSLEEATALIGNIESEIKARSALASKLQEDLDSYNKLVEIKKPEVEAIAQLLRGELKKEGRSTFWKGFVVNFIFFISGSLISFLITIFAK